MNHDITQFCEPKHNWTKSEGKQAYYCMPHHVPWSIHVKRSPITDKIILAIYRKRELVWSSSPTDWSDIVQKFQVALRIAETEMDNEVCHTEDGDYIITD